MISTCYYHQPLFTPCTSFINREGRNFFLFLFQAVIQINKHDVRFIPRGYQVLPFSILFLHFVFLAPQSTEENRRNSERLKVSDNRILKLTEEVTKLRELTRKRNLPERDHLNKQLTATTRSLQEKEKEVEVRTHEGRDKGNRGITLVFLVPTHTDACLQGRKYLSEMLL